MSFTGDESEVITLTDAAAMTAAFRAVNSSGTRGHFFGINQVQKILNGTGCVGLRIYYGKDPSTGARQLIMVGVDSNENDLTSNVILDRSVACPPYCGGGNTLNGYSGNG
ncbi:MAG: hypothetical protein ACXVPQ_11890 [Bacteroidia bacterium]